MISWGPLKDIYSAYSKYSQRFTFSSFRYVTARNKAGLNQFFCLKSLHIIPHNDKFVCKFILKYSCNMTNSMTDSMTVGLYGRQYDRQNDRMTDRMTDSMTNSMTV